MEPKRYATYQLEEELIQAGNDILVGVDEVGRGPGAGPVTAGAVWIPEEALPKLMVKVRDSKQLTEKRREELYELINETCTWAVASVDNTIIDKINILEATKLAMFKALGYVEEAMLIDHALIDGTVRIKDLWCAQTQVIKGDSKSISIAAASIMAKVTRDEEMRTLHWIYPQYDFINNKGYLTPKHLVALQEYGPCKYHRMSFNKVGR